MQSAFRIILLCNLYLSYRGQIQHSTLADIGTGIDDLNKSATLLTRTNTNTFGDSSVSTSESGTDNRMLVNALFAELSLNETSKFSVNVFPFKILRLREDVSYIEIPLRVNLQDIVSISYVRDLFLVPIGCELDIPTCKQFCAKLAIHNCDPLINKAQVALSEYQAQFFTPMEKHVCASEGSLYAGAYGPNILSNFRLTFSFSNNFNPSFTIWNNLVIYSVRKYGAGKQEMRTSDTIMLIVLKTTTATFLASPFAAYPAAIYPIESAQRMDINMKLGGSHSSKIRSFISMSYIVGEDIRLVVSDNKLFGVFNSIDTHFSQHRKICMGEIHIDEDASYAYMENIRILHAHDSDQKNWVPFDYNGRLRFSYSISPHLVLQQQQQLDSRFMDPMQFVSLSFGSRFSNSSLIDSIRDIVANEYPASFDIALNARTSKIDGDGSTWRYGSWLSGGTPAVLLNDNEYIAIFHSRDSRRRRKRFRYFMGAYTFQRHPPHRMTRISKNPIIPPNIYLAGSSIQDRDPSLTAAKFADFVVFPAGLYIDSGIAYICYGVNDMDGYIMSINVDDLLASMIPLL